MTLWRIWKKSRFIVLQGQKKYHQSKSKRFACMCVFINLGKNLLGSSKVPLQNWKIKFTNLNGFATNCLFFVVNRFAYNHCCGSIHRGCHLIVILMMASCYCLPGASLLPSGEKFVVYAIASIPHSVIIHKVWHLDGAYFKENRSRSFQDKVLQTPTGREQIRFHLLIEYCHALWGISCCHGCQNYYITSSKIWMFNIFIKSYQQLSREDKWGYNLVLFLWNLLYFIDFLRNSEPVRWLSQ